MNEQLPILLIAIPLVAAPLCVLLKNRALVSIFAQLVCWSVFAVSVALMAKVYQTGQPISYELGGWPSPYGIVYVVDYLSAFVMMFVSALGAIVLLYGGATIEVEIPRSKHYLFLRDVLVVFDRFAWHVHYWRPV